MMKSSFVVSLTLKIIVMKRLVTLFIASVIISVTSAWAGTNVQQPIYIVDGNVVSIEELKSIDSNDIESMTTIVDKEQLRFFEQYGDTSNGVVVVSLKSREDEDMPFLTADVMPSFMGGDLLTFRNWVMENLRYPQEALTLNLDGDVIVSFVVSRDGYIDIDKISFLKYSHDIFVNEVKRVIALSPRWTPAIQRGRTVPLSFVLPISFNIDKGSDATTKEQTTEVSDNLIVVNAFVKGSDVPKDKHPIWIIDGMPATIEEVEALSPESILNMAVLKDMATLTYYEDYGDTSNGVVVITTKPTDPRVESEPDALPLFRGSHISTFQQWVSENVRYPKELVEAGTEAHILVTFIVDSSGYVEIVKIEYMKGTPNELFDKEIRATLLKSPRWTPATKDGKPVAFRSALPIIFGTMPTPKGKLVIRNE